MESDRKTVATLGDGEATVPVTLLTFPEAELLRTYQAWLDREQLAAQLECGACGKTCQTFVTTGDIGIFCDCRLTLWKVS